MDSFTIETDGRIIGFSMKDILSDTVVDTKSSVLTIRDGTGKVMILGNSKEKPQVRVQINGSVKCKKGSCSIEEIPYYNPSNSSLEVLQSAKKVLNNYILSFEDVRASAGKPVMYRNVNEMKIGQLEDQFGITLNSEVGIDAEKFMIDPIVVKDVEIDGKDILLKLNNATCGISTRENGFDKSKTVLCSKNAMKTDAEELKAFIAVQREQIDTSRKIKLSSHSTRKIDLKFARGPTCYLKGSTMCCKYTGSTDEEPHCY